MLNFRLYKMKCLSSPSYSAVCYCRTEILTDERIIFIDDPLIAMEGYVWFGYNIVINGPRGVGFLLRTFYWNQTGFMLWTNVGNFCMNMSQRWISVTECVI